MSQTEPSRDAPLCSIHFIQKHHQFFVCAHTRYALLVKLCSCLPGLYTAEKMKYVQLGSFQTDYSARGATKRKQNIVVSATFAP